MTRRKNIKQLTSLLALGMLSNINELIALPDNGIKMPVLFIGHGSPMNALEDNLFTRGWKNVAKEIPLPKVILFISAHWLTRGTYVSGVQHPNTIHDFGGFPKALFDVQYPAPGFPELANEIITLYEGNVKLDQEWGLDHGVWSVAKPMYPNANVPCLQLSIDYSRPGEYHYTLAKRLRILRNKGVLIIGSGNMVHNLGMVAFDKINEIGFGFDWALDINETFKRNILEGNHVSLQKYESIHSASKKAIPTPDHYFPLLYSLALQDKNEKVELFNDYAVGGSLTMTSVKIGG